MSGIGLQIVLILALLIANGIFSMSEMAVASSRKARLQQRAEEGDAGARAALDLANDPGRFLSTVQVGITLIGILTGVFGGDALGSYVAGWLANVPGLARFSDALGLGIVVALITYLSLIIGELVPKQLALGNAEGIASRVARPMRFLSTIARPVVYVLSASTSAVLRLLRVRPSGEPAVTEEEITILIEQGAEAGVFQQAERELVDRVFRLGDRRVVDLMVPRHRVVWVDVEDPPEESLLTMARRGYSYYPVCRGDLDHVLGIVPVRDLWSRAVEGQQSDMLAALRPPLFLPESTAAFRALEQFKAAGSSIALVLDEYGGVEGLVTLADLTGDLVGDIGPVEGAPGAVRRDDGSWLVDGAMPLDSFRDFVPVGELPGEEQGYFQTLGGFVQAQLGRLPMAGDRVTWDSRYYEVMDMDGNRIDKVLVSDVPGETPAATTPVARKGGA